MRNLDKELVSAIERHYNEEVQKVTSEKSIFINKEKEKYFDKLSKSFEVVNLLDAIKKVKAKIPDTHLSYNLKRINDVDDIVDKYELPDELKSKLNVFQQKLNKIHSERRELLYILRNRALSSKEYKTALKKAESFLFSKED